MRYALPANKKKLTTVTTTPGPASFLNHENTLLLQFGLSLDDHKRKQNTKNGCHERHKTNESKRNILFHGQNILLHRDLERKFVP